MKPLSPTLRRDEAGYMVVTVMAGVVPLAILSSAIVMLMTTRTQSTSARMADERLVASAEAAAQEGFALVRKARSTSGFGKAAERFQPATDGIDNDRDGEIDELDEVGVAFMVHDWSGDGLDNDGDGRVDEDDEDVAALIVDRQRDKDGVDNDRDGTTDEGDENAMLELVGLARPFANYAGARERRVTMWLQRSAALLPMPNAAVFLGDPNSDVTFNGNSFLVSGIDPVTGAKVPGIGVAGSTASVLTSLRRNQNTLVVGTGNAPSVSTVAPPSPWSNGNAFINDMISTYSGAAEYFLQPGTYTQAPQGGDGKDTDGDGQVDEADESWFGNPDLSKMKVTYAQGDLHFSGNNRGAGLLVVDGNLKITGQFQWHGMVIVRGNLELAGGGSQQKLILGGAYIGSNVTTGVEGSFSISGNAVVQYSQLQMQTLSNELAGYRVWGFRES
ncbi:MAG: hypothetical protein JNM84_25365 [Planctomycetes bacterium]|nr:hypothetical protein [Planctomycetota bacterium]